MSSVPSPVGNSSCSPSAPFISAHVVTMNGRKVIQIQGLSDNGGPVYVKIKRTTDGGLIDKFRQFAVVTIRDTDGSFSDVALKIKNLRKYGIEPPNDIDDVKETTFFIAHRIQFQIGIAEKLIEDKTSMSAAAAPPVGGAPNQLASRKYYVDEITEG